MGERFLFVQVYWSYFKNEREGSQRRKRLSVCRIDSDVDTLTRIKLSNILCEVKVGKIVIFSS